MKLKVSFGNEPMRFQPSEIWAIPAVPVFTFREFFKAALDADQLKSGFAELRRKCFLSVFHGALALPLAFSILQV
jgi:hypothetical protein